jgi:CheY-like chemotaxis protein
LQPDPPLFLARLVVTDAWLLSGLFGPSQLFGNGFSAVTRHRNGGRGSCSVVGRVELRDYLSNVADKRDKRRPMMTARHADERTSVLVADDDENMRSLVAEALRHDGCVVREAHDGVEVLELLDDSSLLPDVIVIDVKMPRLSGLGVLYALRRARLSLPVVLMTGLSDGSIRTAAVKLGAVVVLRKPFGREDILTAICSAKLVHGLNDNDGM